MSPFTLARSAENATSPFSASTGFGSCGEGYFRLSAFGLRENVEEAVARIGQKVRAA